ncbi:Uma2 family endonuclease [Streptomyces sp. NPDC058579]|uniref:Uma2 family endonuclease n=1 Tax=Streptomyces sp. NPDC058579 TaxID=3346548 RepID=UPI003665E629
MIDQSWLEYVQPQVQEFLEGTRLVRLRLTEEGVKLVPVTPAHKKTQRRIEEQIENGLPGFEPIAEFRLVPTVESYNPEPDAAAIPSSLYNAGEPNYHHTDLPFVVEIVSAESKARDYVTKASHYALRGIPSYLVVDVYNGTWELLSDPHSPATAPAEYRTSHKGAFGDPITIAVGATELVLDSSRFEQITP